MAPPLPASVLSALKPPAQVGKYRIALIDGFNCFIRNFSVNEAVTTAGDPCGGIVGVLRFLGNYVEQWNPDQVIMVWEQGGGSPRRKKLFPEYKANRHPIKEARDINTNLSTDSKTLPSKKWVKDDKENKLTQLLTLTEVLKALPVCQVYVSDCECDDVVGYLVREYYSHHRDWLDTITVVSTDRDFYQLLTYPEVRVWDPMRKRIIDSDYVLEEYGTSPENFVLGKAAVGDQSDNIPGVAGIGWKTWRAKFGSLVEKREHLGVSDLIDLSRRSLRDSKVKTGLGAYQKVLDQEDTLLRNVRLMELDSSITLAHPQVSKIKYQIENYTPNLDKVAMIRTLLKAGVVTNIDFDRIHYAWRLLFGRTQEYNLKVHNNQKVP